jgi:general secretion pathway protein F
MRFELRVVKGLEGISTLALEAADGALARDEARRRGYTVLSLRTARGLPALRTRRVRFELVLFAQELHALLQAGLSLVEALESLAARDGAASERAEVLGSVLAKLGEGLSFSDALAGRPDAFPAFFVATVRSSERTGNLAQSLARFAAYRTQLDAVKTKVVSASIYPLLLLGTGGVVLAFLLAYVVPRFSRIFAESGVELPWSTQLLVAWGDAVQVHGAELGALAVALLAAAAWGLADRRIRGRAVQLLWRIGPLGERLRIFQLARYYRTLGMLLEGGLAMVAALDLAAHVAPDSMRAQLAQARKAICEGSALSVALQAAGLTTPVAVRMLRVGERGGNLGTMLGRVADFLDEETARWIEWFTRLFEPLLMAFIGLVIGTIVALMYMPIFNLAGVVQ